MMKTLNEMQLNEIVGGVRVLINSIQRASNSRGTEVDMSREPAGIPAIVDTSIPEA